LTNEKSVRAMETDESKVKENLPSMYSMSRMQSVKLLNEDEKQAESLFILEGITSDYFTKENPPKDWADVSFLIPHEAIRREMHAMVKSVEALNPSGYSESEAWRVLYFSEWYVDTFMVMVHEHHDAEEEIYFPWVATKAAPPDKLTKDHTSLVAMMDEIKEVCEAIIGKKGTGCSDEIAKLKDLVPAFVRDMSAHLKEEEGGVTPLIREHFTMEEEHATVEKILQKGGLTLARNFLPSIVCAMKEWASPGFNEEFKGSTPPPILHLLEKYYMPDYLSQVVPCRDAPTLDEKPTLSKVGCFGLPFCFGCIC